MVEGPFTRSQGSLGEAGGFAVFGNDDLGFEAMVDRLGSSAWADMSINEAIATWAPPDANPTTAYQSFVSQVTGLAGSTRVGDLTREQLGAVAAAIKAFEGWQEGSVVWRLP
jgi:hypothetical protein